MSNVYEIVSKIVRNLPHMSTAQGQRLLGVKDAKIREVLNGLSDLISAPWNMTWRRVGFRSECSPKSLLDLVQRSNCQIASYDYVLNALNSASSGGEFEFSCGGDERQPVELCLATAEELVPNTLYDDHPAFEDILRAIKEKGHLCPPWVAPFLCIGLRDQPVGTNLFFGMEPIRVCLDWSKVIFQFNRCEETRTLRVWKAYPRERFPRDSKWIFVRRK